LHDAAGVLAARAASLSVALDLRTDEALPEVSCDPTRIQQVLVNLIGNALKFSPAGREITLSASQVGTEVWFSVTDAGPGIPADQHELVFERYWRGDTGRPRRYGLGLFIARGSWKRTAAGSGSTAKSGAGARSRFTLPIAREASSIRTFSELTAVAL